MSLTSKVVFTLACGASISTIFYVHYKQNLDRQKLHEGVIKDIERQQMRKLENTYNLQNQAELTKILRKNQEKQDRLQETS